jgi:hypothetical protein
MNRSRPARAWLRSAASLITAAAVAAAVLIAGPFGITSAQPASAASAADFNPGYIVSDAVFFNTGSMNPDQIQSFLNAREPSCSAGYTCLKSYHQDTPTVAADGLCQQYSGSGGESAATIIYKVAQACGISPQVIIVTLEKEQNLVSSTAPTSLRYQRAMGYACPDTAACDTTYYGFFNQVYHAARQFQIYGQYHSSFRYNIGNVYIQYNPTASCGGSYVNIQNQATADLYNYTPYQPNASALANFYGTGDSCGAYGNRNFFRIFSDWFGSPTGVIGDLVRTASDPAVYLLSGSKKYYVPTSAVMDTFSALGPLRSVAASYLSGFTTASNNASALVRDPASGGLFLVQGGARHHFASCGQVSQYGYSCSSYTDLSPHQLAVLPQAGDMSSFFVVLGGATTYWLNGTTRYPVYAWSAVLALNKGASPFVATMDSGVANQYPVGQTLLTSNQVWASSTSSQLWYIDGWNGGDKVAISASMAQEYGFGARQTVSAALLNQYPTANNGAQLGLALQCDGTNYVTSQGKVYSFSGSAAPGGLAVFKPQEGSCALLHYGGPVAANKLFVKTPGNSVVYAVSSGHAQAVPSWSALMAMTSGATPTILTWSVVDLLTLPQASPGFFVKTANDATVYQLMNGKLTPMRSWSELVAAGGSSAAIATWSMSEVESVPMSSAPLAAGAVAKAANSASIYLINGSASKLHVASLTTTSELGLPTWAGVDQPSLDFYKASAGDLSRVVQCSGQQYFAAAGTLYPIASSAATGLTVTTLDSTVCAKLKRSTAAALAKVFVRDPSDATVYYVTGGKREPVSSWTRLVQLAGTSSPQILTTGANGLADVAVGPSA